MFSGRLFPRLFFASPNNPVFGADDRVTPPGGGGGGDGLPAELAGKSPAEIARYYNEREARLRAELTPPPNPNPPPSNTDFWNNPNDAVTRQIRAQALSKEEYDRMAASVRPSIIWAAKMQCKERHPDFHRVENRVMDIMAKMPEWQQTDPVIWETVYVQAKGLEYDRLSTEDRVSPPTSSEPVSPGGSPPAPQTDLSKVTAPGVGGKTAAHVVNRLGITSESYLKSQAELAGDGLLPLTYDNRGKK